MEVSKIGFITFDGKFEDGSLPHQTKEDGCSPCGTDSPSPTSTDQLAPRSFLPVFPSLSIRPPLSYPSPLKDGSFPYMSLLYGRDELLRNFLISKVSTPKKPKPSTTKKKKKIKSEAKGAVDLQEAILACSSSEEIQRLLASSSPKPPVLIKKTGQVRKKMLILQKVTKGNTPIPS